MGTADAARFGKEEQQHRVRCSELEEAIGFLKVKQSKLLATMERKQKVGERSPGGNSILKMKFALFPRLVCVGRRRILQVRSDGNEPRHCSG